MFWRKFYLFPATFFCYLPVYASSVTLSHKDAVHRAVPLPGKEASIGDIANGLFGFTQDIRQLFKTVAITVGVGIIIFGIMQYKKHRMNPVETPLGKVIMTIVIGLGLIALSFIPFKF